MIAVERHASQEQQAAVAERQEGRLTLLIHERRATPRFSSAAVRSDDLRQILLAGLEAPSGYNLQPWRFVVVRDAEQRKRLRAAAMDQDKVEQAPVIIVACADSEAWPADLEESIRIGREHGFDDEAQIEAKRKRVREYLEGLSDLGVWLTRQTMIAATTMMWVAEVLGYDTAPMEGFCEEQVREELAIPQRVRVIFLLAVGRLEGEDKKYPGRFAPSRTVFAERYGEPLGI